MSEEDEEEGSRKRRAPLSRSRRLSSRRRRKSAEEDDAEEGGSEGEAGVASPSAAAENGPEDGNFGSDDADEQDFTRPVPSLPSAPGSGSPDFPLVSAPPSEQWASLQGSVRRFGIDFSSFLGGLGRSATVQGQAFGRDVVKPLSSALIEAALSLALIFVMGVVGVYFGRHLRLATQSTSTAVAIEHQAVQPGQKIDESFFSQGFKTEELHSLANRVLKDYLKALQDQEFRVAYDLLSPEWRSELSFESFQAGYATTQVTAYEIGKAETVDQSHVRIKAEIEVEENGERKILEALYLAVLSPQGWRLDGGSFR